MGKRLVERRHQVRRGVDKAEAVVLTDGEVLPVDRLLMISDPAISGIGDCADFPHAALGARTRLDSVQNAVDQGRCVAARLAGKPAPYDSLAWFWSDQAVYKLTIAASRKASTSGSCVAKRKAAPSRPSAFVTAVSWSSNP